jgi:hypothetical protein
MGRLNPHAVVRGSARPVPVEQGTAAATCKSCEEKKAGPDGLCAFCRPPRPRPSRRKYPPLTPELATELRLAFVGGFREVAANLNRISARTGLPKTWLKEQACQQGWRSKRERRPWTSKELDYLQEMSGVVPITKIARALGRSFHSLSACANKVRLSYRLRAGYNVSDLCQVFGLSHTRIESWVARGLLGEAQGHGGLGGHLRFSEANVEKFVREHPGEYALGRVDETWFKYVVFGHLTEREEATDVKEKACQ